MWKKITAINLINYILLYCKFLMERVLFQICPHRQCQFTKVKLAALQNI